MIIVGCDFHPSWQQIASWIQRRARSGNANWSTATGERSGFIVRCRCRRWLAWKHGQQSVVCGLAGGVWGMKCGSAMRRRFGPVMCASRRPTSAMRHTF